MQTSLVQDKSSLAQGNWPLAAVAAQPWNGTQASSVHALPSSQSTALPTQLPSTQVSEIVQGSPSSHATAVGAYRHGLAPPLVFASGLQTSTVQGLPSLQITALPTHALNAVHVSPPVQLLPSEQGKPARIDHVVWLTAGKQPTHGSPG